MHADGRGGPTDTHVCHETVLDQPTVVEQSPALKGGPGAAAGAAGALEDPKGAAHGAGRSAHGSRTPSASRYIYGVSKMIHVDLSLSDTLERRPVSDTNARIRGLNNATTVKKGLSYLYSISLALPLSKT